MSKETVAIAATVSSVDNDQIELLSFLVGDYEYSVDIMSVREIRGWTTTTSLPRSPSYVRGVINLRGTVLPVIDLALRLGLPFKDPDERNVIVVVDILGRTIGLRVDAVSDILSVTRSELHPPPELASDQKDSLISALTLVEDRMVRVLELACVLPSESESVS